MRLKASVFDNAPTLLQKRVKNAPFLLQKGAPPPPLARASTSSSLSVGFYLLVAPLRFERFFRQGCFFWGAVAPGRQGICRCLALTAGPARHRVVRYYGRSLGGAPIPLPPLPRGTLPAASAKFHRVLISSARRDHAYSSTNNHVISK